jgi:Stage II sporulation protein E (SpoIIE)
MRLQSSLLVLLLTCSRPCTRGQIVDLQKDRIQITKLTGPWCFHTGDASAWADPAFDDTGWSRLTPDRSWFTQGYRDYAGPAWYRLHITAPEGTNDLAIFFPLVRSSYAVYANGSLIGQTGGLPPHPRAMFSANAINFIPRRLIAPDRALVLAVRVWYWPPLAGSDGGGIDVVPVLGDAGAVARWRDLQIHDAFWASAIDCVLFAANALSALLALSLFALRRAEREYFWFGVAQICWTIASAASMAPEFLRIPLALYDLVYVFSLCGGIFLNLVFFHVFLQQRRRALFWIGALPILLSFPMICLALAGWITFEQFSRLQAIAFVPYSIAVSVLLIRSACKENSEARLLVLPYTISCFGFVYAYALTFLDMSRHSALDTFEQHLEHLIWWPFPVDYFSLIGLLCISSVCGVLILRFARSRRDEERLASELEAARVVQQILVPAENPSIPGFAIEAVYRPSGQVGGDFYQIVPTGAGSVLAVIGDVSGKGMPAAMTVSLLVGTFRTLAHYTQSPGEILGAMNQRMLTRSRGGFTTCMVLRIDLDGSATAANAGHLLPYLDGCEIELENGLPLGLDPDSAYPESSFSMGPGAQLLLTTDGVVEARGKSGALFGFERTAAISTEPAEEIARAAEFFGQEDDITVLTFRLSSEEVLHAAK